MRPRSQLCGLRTAKCRSTAIRSRLVESRLIAINLAMAIGGKGWVSMTGDVASVTEAVEVGSAVIVHKGLLVDNVVIPAPRPKIVSGFV